MGTTDAKPGFRLPWSSDRSEAGDQVDTSSESSSTTDPANDTPAADAESTAATDAPASAEDATADPAPTDPVVAADTPVTAADDTTPAADEPSAAATSEPEPAPEPAQAVAPEPEPAPVRKPNKFMADLTKAMQAAAESARGETLEKFAADAKTHIEAIHASTADEATELRKKADDDIAAIREWSKAEIARIREETDERITHRKTVLDREVEAHAADIESRIEAVQLRVNAFEREMADFFERLLAEDDPTRFAAMAERLPEPPSFDADAAWEPQGLIGVEEGAAGHDRVPVEEPDATTEAVEATTEATAEAVATDAWSPTADTAEGHDRWSLAADTPTVEVDTTSGGWDSSADDRPVAAWDAPSDVTAEASAQPVADAPSDDADPRLAALGLATGVVEAGTQPETVAEADAPAGAAGSDADIPTIADDALAARLSGLVQDPEAGSAELVTTNVVVTGLISVASIAGFKRHLSRVPGVGAVGVSSGPDGEFVFAVGHAGGLPLGDAITTLPGFAARVTGEREGELVVTARDPEAES